MRYFNKIALIYDKEEQDAREKADLRRRQANAARVSTIANTLGLLGVGGYALRQNAISKSIGNLKQNLETLGTGANPKNADTPVDQYLAKLLSNNTTGTEFIGDEYAKRSLPNKVLSYFGFGPKGDISNVPGILGEKGTQNEAIEAFHNLLGPHSDTHEASLGDLGKAESFFKDKSVTPKNIALALGGLGLLTGGSWAYDKYKQMQHEKEIQNVRNKERQYSIDHPVRYNLKRWGF